MIAFCFLIGLKLYDHDYQIEFWIEINCWGERRRMGAEERDLVCRKEIILCDVFWGLFSFWNVMWILWGPFPKRDKKVAENFSSRSILKHSLWSNKSWNMSFFISPSLTNFLIYYEHHMEQIRDRCWDHKVAASAILFESGL